MIIIPPTHQPDVTVGPTLGRNGHRGNNVYSSGRGQTLMRTRAPGKTLRTFFSLQNDGSSHDTYNSFSTHLRSRHHKRKTTWNGSNITAALVTGRLQIQIATQSYENFVVTDSPRRSRSSKKTAATTTWMITLRSVSDPTKFDTAVSMIRTRPIKKAASRM